MRLLLFDIDLTLINSGGAGRRAMSLAFEKIFAKKNGLKNVNLAGRTDPQILKDALAHKGLEWSAEKEEAFKQSYFACLKSEMKKPNPRKRIQPGILGILRILSGRRDITLGLLTGNWHQGAVIKLEYFNLYNFFKIGAFSDDSEFREKLPYIAVKRLQENYGISILPENVYIIGDTPLDVACAKPFGAKSVAVATGFFSYDELQASNPDYIFQNLNNYQKFLQVFDEEN